MAYSRNPSDLFESEDGNRFTPPMNRCGVGHDGRQPVHYTNVRLRLGSDDSALVSGDALPFVNVHWRTGELSVYATLDDYSCGVPCLQMTIRPPTQAWPSAVYAYEVEQFVRRGHSLSDPECQCAHGMPAIRTDQLGISPSEHRTGACALPAAKRHNMEQVSAELALGSPLSFVDDSGSALLELISIFLSSDRTHVQRVRILDASTLVAEAKRVWPRPIRPPSPSSSYIGLARDVENLRKKLIIRVISKGVVGDGDLFFYEPTPHNHMAVDADVRELWNSVTARRDV